MSASGKPDLPGWLGLARAGHWSRARWLGPVLSGVVLLLFALALVAAGAILVHAIFGVGHNEMIVAAVAVATALTPVKVVQLYLYTLGSLIGCQTVTSCKPHATV